MPLFTIILEYGGGAYIRHVRSGSAKKAVINGLSQFEVLHSRIRKQLASDVAREELVEVEGTKGVWCCSAVAERSLILLHIIATAG